MEHGELVDVLLWVCRQNRKRKYRNSGISARHVVVNDVAGNLLNQRLHRLAMAECLLHMKKDTSPARKRDPFSPSC
eukprot:1314536-Amorphochlora_amoeboformis.AAC.1